MSEVIIKEEETEVVVHPERFRLDADSGEYSITHRADSSDVRIRHRNGYVEVLATDLIKFAQAIR